MEHGPGVTPLSGPLETKAWLPLDDAALRKLRRLALFHRLFAFMFSLSMLSVFGGFFGGLCTGEEFFSWLIGIGMALGFIGILNAYLVYPYMRCPRCKQPYFLPSSGLERFFARVDVTQKACLHCQLPLKARQPTN